MGNNVTGQQLSQLDCKGNQPAFPSASFHCIIIFPVDIHAIEIVRTDIAGQLGGTSQGIYVSISRKFSCAENTDEDFDSVLVVFALEKGLHLFLGLAEGVVLSEELHWIIPESHCIEGPVLVGPEGQGNIVVVVIGGVFGHCHRGSNLFRRPPVGDLVDIGEPNGAIDLPRCSMLDRQVIRLQKQSEYNYRLAYLHRCPF